MKMEYLEGKKKLVYCEVKIRDEIILKEPYSQPINMVDDDLLMMNIRSKEGKLLNLKRQIYGYEKCQGIPIFCYVKMITGSTCAWLFTWGGGYCI